ncbi:outer membrane protein assembly factor [Parasegetibacter sp. NRK P23]|uniref:BamA/OMP85 family outer membrane protein n=1 Tax=Parasegetibacter sp. NRK P23 TaxID=2942999 RepID=UPI002043B7D4|nr:POTRA domain-containing protein [Parasegetibacter sp. NRK P23]MCM5529416.1 outer membrane protein assembly factor [Parasegetibacter sp. NRK P23]
MQRKSKLAALLFVFSLLSSPALFAQVTDTTTQEVPDLFNSRNPQEYTVAEVVVTGNKRYDNSLVISIAGINVGDKILIPGGDAFSKAIQNIWKQNLFANIRIYITKVVGNRIYIELAVTERPGLNNYIFKGIKKSESDELKEKTGMVKGRPITENMKRTAEENIRKYYKEKGFQNVTIDIDETPVAGMNNANDVVITIDKGRKVKVNQVAIYGNDNASDLKIKKQMKGTKEMTRITLYPVIDSSTFGVNDRPDVNQYLNNKGYLSLSKTKEFLDPWFRFKLFSSAKFNEQKYREDKEKVVTFYNSLGFRDASIEKDSIYNGGNGNLNIDIKVNEGHKYYFGNITWKGNTKYSDSLLNYLLGIKKGDVYNLETLEKKLGKQMSPEGGDISGLYMDDGYLFFSVDPVETAVYNDTIDFEIMMREGPQATIKNVRISGNDKTKEYVIRREIRTVPGEKFSRADLIRSNREIANLGYFNQENIGIVPIPNQDDGTVDINYTVEEKSSDQLELSAGWGGGIGLTGTLGVSFNNFSVKNIFNKKSWDPLPTGDGQKLSLRVQSNGRAFRSYNFSFTEPWLGGKKRNPFTISFFNTKFSNAFDYTTYTYSRARSDSSYLKNTGVTVALGKQLKWPDDYFSLTTAVNYTQYKLKNYQVFGFGGQSNLTSHNINLKLTLQRYSLDQPTFPRSGSNFMLSGQFTPPYSLINKSLEKSADPYKLVEYHKWRFNGEWYVPIGKAMGADKNRQFVLKFAAKYGFMGRYNSKMPFSPFERFQVGDAGLTNNFGVLGYDIIAHRGYPVYESSDPKVNPDQQSAQQFFTIFNKYTMELRFPFSTNPSSTIYGLTFFEAANGWYDFKEYNPFRLRRSAGVGMRFFLPMFGLLGFDYGIGFDRMTPNGRLRDAARFTFMLGFEPE